MAAAAATAALETEDTEEEETEEDLATEVGTAAVEGVASNALVGTTTTGNPSVLGTKAARACRVAHFSFTFQMAVLGFVVCFFSCRSAF